jgi:hypothetical protein
MNTQRVPAWLYVDATLELVDLILTQWRIQGLFLSLEI